VAYLVYNYLSSDYIIIRDVFIVEETECHKSKDNIEKVQVDTAGIVTRPPKLQVEIHHILKHDVNHIYD
jgi:uncharacterized protein YpiB (UPF0302 family)